jgi:hypothetical protein
VLERYLERQKSQGGVVKQKQMRFEGERQGVRRTVSIKLGWGRRGVFRNEVIRGCNTNAMTKSHFFSKYEGLQRSNEKKRVKSSKFKKRVTKIPKKIPKTTNKRYSNSSYHKSKQK